MYNNAEETSDIAVNSKRRILTFTKKFACIGLVIFFLLEDTIDVQNRVIKASKAMGALRFI